MDAFDLSEYPCFACGGVMTHFPGGLRQCRTCDVYEMRLPEPYIPLTRTVLTVPGGEWEGLSYLDHSLGHYPSPA